MAAPAFFHNLPHELQPLLESGILLSAVVSVILNVFFNGLGSVDVESVVSSSGDEFSTTTRSSAGTIIG